MNTDPIRDFILAEKNNLTIAAAVANAWAKTRQHLVSGFLDRLESRLKRTLKGWQSDREQKFYENSWACYDLWKPDWNNEYGLGLIWYDYGKKIAFGIYRDKDNFGQRPFCPDVLKAVAAIDPSAGKNPWWEAQILMKHPATDWSNPDVLWQMHTDEGFLQSVTDQLLEVAKITEPVIDQWMRRKQR